MVLVDSRIGSAEYLAPLSKRLNGQAAAAVLESGDFAWEGCGKDSTSLFIGVELKKLSDLLVSMRSGRYQEQIAKMAEDYQICYLIIEGSFKPDEEGMICVPARGGWRQLIIGRSRFMYAELDKFLASVEVVENVIVRKSCRQEDTVEQLVDLYNWWQVPYDSHTSTKAMKYQSGLFNTRASTCRKVAAQLPHVGWEIAGKVESKFKTIDAMVNAEIGEWAEISWKSVKGRKNSIGEKRAMDIVKEIRGIK